MHYPTYEEPRVFESGIYTCPVNKVSVELETDVPRPWVHWPIRVRCSACQQVHTLRYEDVMQHEPAFGRE